VLSPQQADMADTRGGRMRIDCSSGWRVGKDRDGATTIERLQIAPL
jgi:hypothetical protein